MPHYLYFTTSQPLIEEMGDVYLFYISFLAISSTFSSPVLGQLCESL